MTVLPPDLPRRPRLTPVLRRLWRDAETLQLGVDPDRAVVLAGLHRDARAVLPLLDGTRASDQVLRDASAHGCSPERAVQVLGLLQSAGALDDAARPADLPAQLSLPERDRLAPEAAALRLIRGSGGGCDVLRRRATARVAVHGAGRVGAPVAALLACAGVGFVDVADVPGALVRAEDCGVGGLPLTDIGTPRAAAVRRLLGQLAPATRTDALQAPELTVLAPPDGHAEAPPHDNGPVLLARVVDGKGVVGPLVQPSASACLRCLDLHRADRDPDWPVVAAQLSQPARQVATADAAMTLAVAAQAAREALAFLDGTRPPDSLGGTLELAPTQWRWRRRSWQVHPDCPCSSTMWHTGSSTGSA